MFLVPCLSLVFDTMIGRCFKSRAWWMKKKIQDFCQAVHTQEACLLIFFHLPCPRFLFTHPHCSSRHSPADEMPTRDVSPLYLSHWDHTAALGLRDGLWGKATHQPVCCLCMYLLYVLCLLNQFWLKRWQCLYLHV